MSRSGPKINPRFPETRLPGVVNSRMGALQKLFDLNTGGGIITWVTQNTVTTGNQPIATLGSHVVGGLTTKIQATFSNLTGLPSTITSATVQTAVNNATQSLASKVRMVIAFPSSLTIAGLPVSLSGHIDMSGYIRNGISRVIVGR